MKQDCVQEKGGFFCFFTFELPIFESYALAHDIVKNNVGWVSGILNLCVVIETLLETKIKSTENVPNGYSFFSFLSFCPVMFFFGKT